MAAVVALPKERNKRRTERAKGGEEEEEEVNERERERERAQNQYCRMSKAKKEEATKEERKDLWLLPN